MKVELRKARAKDVAVLRRLMQLYLYDFAAIDGWTISADGLYGDAAIEDYWTTIGRFDHAFSEKDRMFVRVHRDFWQEDKNRIFGDDITGLILNRINRGLGSDQMFCRLDLIFLSSISRRYRECASRHSMKTIVEFEAFEIECHRRKRNNGSDEKSHL